MQGAKAAPMSPAAKFKQRSQASPTYMVVTAAAQATEEEREREREAAERRRKMEALQRKASSTALARSKTGLGGGESSKGAPGGGLWDDDDLALHAEMLRVVLDGHRNQLTEQEMLRGYESTMADEPDGGTLVIEEKKVYPTIYELCSKRPPHAV